VRRGGKKDETNDKNKNNEMKSIRLSVTRARVRLDFDHEGEN